MITLSPTVQELVESDMLNYFYLVSIKDDMNYTTAPFDLGMQNGVTYSADGGLAGVEPPRVSAVVDRATYKIAFADPEQTLKSYFESGATGDDVSVRLGFFNTLGREVEGIPPGGYFKQLANTLLVYKGVIDTQAIDIDPAQGTILATIECSSPMADLDLVRAFFTNRDSMKTRNPNDGAFDEVFSGASEVQYNWGKI